MTTIGAIFTGFDSAWTDSPKKPGAIASIIDEGLGHLSFEPPQPATFSDAKTIILRLAEKTPAHIIGIDQPTIVPNIIGMRPVEKVVAHLIGKMGGGVQPANRKTKAAMFGDGAPIWPFLSSLPHEQSPFHAIRANSGGFLLEVYPALNILGLFPFFTKISRLPKYNPDKQSQFRLCDWRRLTYRIGRYGSDNRIEGLPKWARSMMALPKPAKADQDAVDAAICAIQAFHWWSWGYDRSVVIGDQKSGYMVSAATPWMKKMLKAEAHRRSVPFEKRW